MEIITNIAYDGHRHALNAFTNKHKKIMLIPMMHHKKVEDAFNNRNLVDAIEVILNYKWITGRLATNATTGQSTYLKLAGGIKAIVYLIANEAGDRLCLVDVDQPGAAKALIVAFVGDKNIFKHYMTQLNITDLEVYSRLLHLDEEED